MIGIDPVSGDPVSGDGVSADVVLVAVADETTTITVTLHGDADTAPFVVPCGAVSLAARHIHNDPPLPQELTNAIGEMLDHIEDAKRERPHVLAVATVVVTGPIPTAIAAVEVGGPVPGREFALTRQAAEDVFRTVATENRADRRRNPGLPADLVDDVVGGCCVLVGLIRGLQLDGVTVRGGGAGS